MASTRLRPIALILIASLLLLAPLPDQADALPFQQAAYPQQGCTTLYAFDGETALGGNNEDLNNPYTLVWFIPASPGRFGRVYFGYDDYLPQGGLNDQGVFYDDLALVYKAMPETSQRPHFPGGELALVDEVLSRSASVQDVIDITGRWNRLAGEFAQHLYGDRFGDSVIIDGDTILRKEGAFRLPPTSVWRKTPTRPIRRNAMIRCTACSPGPTATAWSCSARRWMPPTPKAITQPSIPRFTSSRPASSIYTSSTTSSRRR